MGLQMSIINHPSILSIQSSNSIIHVLEVALRVHATFLEEAQLIINNQEAYSLIARTILSANLLRIYFRRVWQHLH